jgi:hypothetical protein
MASDTDLGPVNDGSSLYDDLVMMWGALSDERSGLQLVFLAVSR